MILFFPVLPNILQDVLSISAWLTTQNVHNQLIKKLPLFMEV
jgi:hypothetical protein